MRDLTTQESSSVSGGVEVVCTYPSTITVCQIGAMPPEFLIEATFSLYDAAVEATTALFEWMFGDVPEEAP